MTDTAKQSERECPFTKPGYVLDVNTPCPVCGELGTLESPVKCIDYPHLHDLKEAQS